MKNKTSWISPGKLLHTEIHKCGNLKGVFAFFSRKNHTNIDCDQKVLHFAGSNFFSYSNPGSNGTHNLIFHELSFCFSEASHNLLLIGRLSRLQFVRTFQVNMPVTSVFQNLNFRLQVIKYTSCNMKIWCQGKWKFLCTNSKVYNFFLSNFIVLGLHGSCSDYSHGIF